MQAPRRMSRRGSAARERPAPRTTRGYWPRAREHGVVSANPAIVGQASALVGSRKAVTAVALALGTFMQVLDTSIANVSIPTIAGNLGVSADEGTWVITSFAVANGIAVPVTGWLMQRYGVVRVFVMAMIAFAVASFLCGIAWSLGSLILFRVLQGAVAGPLNPGSQALLLLIFRE